MCLSRRWDWSGSQGGTGVTCGGFPPGVVVPGLPEGMSNRFGVLVSMSHSWVRFVTHRFVYDFEHFLVLKIILS